MRAFRLKFIMARAVTAGLLFCGWFLLCSVQRSEPDEADVKVADDSFSFPIDLWGINKIFISRMFATPYTDGSYNRTLDLMSDGDCILATESGQKVIETTSTSVTLLLNDENGASRLIIYDGLSNISVKTEDILNAGTYIGISNGIFKIYIKESYDDGSIHIIDPIPYLSRIAEYTNSNIQLVYNNQDILSAFQDGKYTPLYEEVRAAVANTNYAVQSQNTVPNQKSQQVSGGLLDWLFSVDLGGLIGLIIGGWIVLKVLGLLFTFISGKETYYYGGQKFDNSTDWITRMEEDDYYEKHHR